jgi:RNA 3'-terminal phosphate cyclase (ATP)
VGEHLADQLMIPLALLAGGRYRTLEPSLHARTNADVVNLFLPGAVRLEPRGANDWLVTVAGRS